MASWSKIQRSHRPFLKSAWYLVTYITPTLLHLITLYRQPIHTARGSRPLESALNTRTVELFQLNPDSQVGIDSTKTETYLYICDTFKSSWIVAKVKRCDPKLHTSQLLLDKTPVLILVTVLQLFWFKVFAPVELLKTGNKTDLQVC